MRIACVHVPQFALQTLTRIDPSLRGSPVAVVGPGVDGARPGARAASSSPVVQACSRAAWSLGIRIGMTAVSAHALAPGQLRVVTADGHAERETVRAIAEALLGVSAVVDVGSRSGAGAAHLALFCEVPSKTRGASFGDRLLELLETLGLTARIGIADDRFTAWVAAAHGGPIGEERGVVSVPRGGSAAFLAPRPLSLLSITPEVQHMLEALGVRTLGEFAMLPAPSVARPFEADYQALARGESGHALRPYAPEAPIREDIVVASGGAAVAALAARLALRLAGRARGAARIELSVATGTDVRTLEVTPLMAPMARLAAARGADEARVRGHVLEDAEELAEAIAHALGGELASGTRLRATVALEASAGDAPVDVAALQHAPIDALAVALSTTGSAWHLTPSGAASLRGERRDAHRRTRRGKQHRRARGASLVQPPLFADHRK